MKSKIAVRYGTQNAAAVRSIIILSLLIASGECAENNNSILHKVVTMSPIVIRTEFKDYNNPTFEEYRLCQSNRAKCVDVCDGIPNNKTECLEQCPVCPILIGQEVVVQGINDTDAAPSAPSRHINTTNVIRVTNQIRNIIENSVGDVGALNQNNLNIYQNRTSTTGGEFGLGYDGNVSCCLVVRSSVNCHSPTYFSSSRCHHRRHRVCSASCKARVMYAKRTTTCPDLDKENCYQSVRYVPHPVYYRRQQPICQHTNQWPFVTCHDRNVPDTSMCYSCLRIPYINVVLHQLPLDCLSCFSGTNNFMQQQSHPLLNLIQPAWVMPQVPFYPIASIIPQPFLKPVTPGIFDGNDYDEESHHDRDAGWEIESIIEDGSVTSDCSTEVEAKPADESKTPVTTGPPIFPPNDLEILPEAQDAPDPDDYEYDDDQAVTHQKNHLPYKFPVIRRSAYSHKRRRQRSFN